MTSLSQSFKNLGSSWKNAVKELKKIRWPDKPTVVENTLVVVGCTAIFAVFLWACDVLLGAFFNTFLY